MTQRRTVHLLTLGCARNETDSDELAARLANAGWELVDDVEAAEAVLVNTCGFVESAKQESIEALQSAAELKSTGTTKAVVAVGCLAERYGSELASALPEADGVLGFDRYEEIGDLLAQVVGGLKVASHEPQDRRLLAARAPIERANARGASSGEVLRLRLDSKPYAPLKIASGCDRRCSFCAIPRFRGAYQSRRPTDIIAEAVWLAERGVKELFLVSENTTSYGKDLGELRLLESVLPALAGIDGIERVRLSYLQPAEFRPTLLEAIAETYKVVPYFDLSFQHCSSQVLRRMRRFGGSDEFLKLVGNIREALPEAGIRSNFIVGFPGETDADVEELCDFISAANLDVVGLFGYSDEDQTEAETFTDKIDPEEVRRRVEYVTSIADEVVTQRAEDRIGSFATVLVESTGPVEGRTEFQGPEVDGTTTVEGVTAAVGDVLAVEIIASDGADLMARVR